MKTLLKGLRVLNTRPVNQGKPLSGRIQDAGGIAIDCPAIDIHPSQEDWLKTLPSLRDIHYAIFISSNAVTCAFDALNKARIDWPESLKVIAIGQATAAALKQQSIPVESVPETENSEHLLELDIFQSIHKQKVLLFKGEGGRPLIEETLRQRGANLFIMEVYQRTVPHHDQGLINSIWQNDTVDIILITSAEALHNLIEIFGPAASQWLLNKPFLLISERLAAIATKQGIKKIMLCKPDSIFETLCEYNQGHLHDTEQ